MLAPFWCRLTHPFNPNPIRLPLSSCRLHCGFRWNPTLHGRGAAGKPLFARKHGRCQHHRVQRTGNQTTDVGTGSGFVIDKQGHIVTNNHVVASATGLEVTFSDGRVADAQVVGADGYSDLAVIKVDVPASWLTPVELGDSDAVKVGQHVVAIGNPFGLQGSMTMGIVSALGRTLPPTSKAPTPVFSRSRRSSRPMRQSIRQQRWASPGHWRARHRRERGYSH